MSSEKKGSPSPIRSTYSRSPLMVITPIRPESDYPSRSTSLTPSNPFLVIHDAESKNNNMIVLNSTNNHMGNNNTNNTNNTMRYKQNPPPQPYNGKAQPTTAVAPQPNNTNSYSTRTPKAVVTNNNNNYTANNTNTKPNNYNNNNNNQNKIVRCESATSPSRRTSPSKDRLHKSDYNANTYYYTDNNNNTSRHGPATSPHHPSASSRILMGTMVVHEEPHKYKQADRPSHGLRICLFFLALIAVGLMTSAVLLPQYTKSSAAFEDKVYIWYIDMITKVTYSSNADRVTIERQKTFSLPSESGCDVDTWNLFFSASVISTAACVFGGVVCLLTFAHILGDGSRKGLPCGILLMSILSALAEGGVVCCIVILYFTKSCSGSYNGRDYSMALGFILMCPALAIHIITAVMCMFT